MNRTEQEKINGIKAIAKTNESGFRNMLICEVDRYQNIIIYWNPEIFEDRDDEYFIDCTFFKNQLYLDNDKQYSEEMVADLEDYVIENYAMFLIDKIEPVETTVIPVKDIDSKHKDTLCGHLKAINNLGYNIDKEI